ncbi:unnamed protein product [Trichobilharzia regenti]|nr:unnamed protein product [Trichobilharzia regenti]
MAMKRIHWVDVKHSVHVYDLQNIVSCTQLLCIISIITII